MHIELPQDVIERVKRRTAEGKGISEADVIRKALDSLDWQDCERRAVQEGIAAMESGRVRNFEEFDRDFRQNNGIAARD